MTIMNCPPAILILVLLQGPAVADMLTGDDGEPYRVTGIVSEGQDRHMALIELPDGKYLRLQEGDTFDEGKVLEISRRWLRVAFPNGERLLWLTGLQPEENVAVSGKTAGERQREQTQNHPDHIFIRPLDKDKIAEIRQLASRTRVSGADVITVLGPILDLPLDAQLIAINEISMDDVKNPLAHIKEMLAKGHGLTMTLDNPDGKEPGRVYIMPVSENTGTPD